MRNKNLFYLIFSLLFSVACSTESQKMSIDDYERAVSFLYSNYNNKSVFNLNTQINWFTDNSGAWFIDYSKEGKEYKVVNFNNYEVTTLFTTEELVNRLSKYLNKSITLEEAEISQIQPIENGFTFRFQDQQFRFNRANDQIELIENKSKENRNPFESISPDKQWVAFTKGHNLFIRSIKKQREYQLSFDGKKGYEYGSYYGWFDKMEGEHGERPKRFTVNWSADSKYLSTNIVDTRHAEKMYLLDYNDPKSNFKPKLVSYYRGSPGDSTMVKQRRVFFDITKKKQIQTDLPTTVHINTVSTTFANNSSKVIVNYLERGFQKGFFKELDLQTGKSTVLYEESSITNIDKFWSRYLKDANKIIFLSQKSGWQQIYVCDVQNKVVKPITTGDFVVNEVLEIDEENQFIYFLASGKEEQENPYHQKLYQTDFEGNITLITPEKGHHNISISPNKKVFVDNFSTIEVPTTAVLRELTTGKILATLTKANIDGLKDIGWDAPETFSLTAKDGKTTIYGAIWKPTNFDSSKKYPIIDATYTGPHTQVYPKSFSNALSLQSLAELGFIVMRVDGLGTAGRSKEFLNHSYKNMGNNLEDHVLAIQYLANEYSWIDIDKVGIYGHSAGGYDTGRAMLAFPDFYKVGVASSADHDFRMEKAWWPEMYQGWPVDSTYHEVSNITNAANLKGKLLLVHGGMDDNVNPSATFALAEALVNADKEFDLLILPSQRHGYQGKARNYFTKKRWNYFIEHLQEKEPIWNFSLE